MGLFEISKFDKTQQKSKGGVGQAYKDYQEDRKRLDELRLNKEIQEAFNCGDTEKGDLLLNSQAEQDMRDAQKELESLNTSPKNSEPKFGLG